MAKKKQHLQQALRNSNVKKELGGIKSKYPEWIITLSFYEAIHKIEAVFSIMPSVRHTELQKKSGESASRARWRLVKNNFSRKTLDAYFALEQASKATRYLLNGYSDYYSKSAVKELAVDELKVIENEVKGKKIS